MRRSRRQAGPYGIEINIGHAGGDGSLVEQRLAAEPSLPEPASATVLGVRPPGQRLRKTLHEPGDAGEPPPQLGNSCWLVGEHINPGGGQWNRIRIANGAMRVDLNPTAGDFLISPLGCDIGTVAHNEVKVITQDRESHDIHGEQTSQLLQAILEPLLAMVVGPPGDGISTAKIGPANAAIDAMISPDLLFIDDITASSSCH